MHDEAVSRASRTRARVGRSLLLGIAALALACQSEGRLETRTFDLQFLEPSEAADIVMPYVYAERAAAPGMITTFQSGITVRETPEALDRIAVVLERYDRERPGVRLHFRVIEADGFEETDERIADVREALDALFRFEGYRLATEAEMALSEGARSSQPVATAERAYELAAWVGNVRVATEGDGGSVTVGVRLSAGVVGHTIETTLTVPLGETVVLGSGRRSASEPTTILTVRPELVEY
ncbi:MAG: hypothetical protein ABFS34_01040 [Gemmatimonadota bacterium]